MSFAFFSVFKLLSKWTTAVRARCCDPFRKIRKWWNPKFQSVMDVSSRFGVCEVTPCTWYHLHNRITFQWRGKKKEREREGERETHMSNASATIRETVYNYLFVCSSSRWRWWSVPSPRPQPLSHYRYRRGCVKHTVFVNHTRCGGNSGATRNQDDKLQWWQGGGKEEGRTRAGVGWGQVSLRLLFT